MFTGTVDGFVKRFDRWAEQPCQLVYTSRIRFLRSVRADALVEVWTVLAFIGDTNMRVEI